MRWSETACGRGRRWHLPRAPPQPGTGKGDQRLGQRPKWEPPGQQDGRRVLPSGFPVGRVVKMQTDETSSRPGKENSHVLPGTRLGPGLLVS